MVVACVHPRPKPFERRLDEHPWDGGHCSPRIRPSRISTRALAIHGRNDPLVPPEHGADLANRIPDARLKVIDDFGHEMPPPHLIEELAVAIAAHARDAPLAST